MSLVQCPECGRQISSGSESCIHCGFAFKICPDCGAVLPKDAPRCTECGRQFKEENAAEPKKQEQTKQESSKQEAAEVTKFDGYMDEFISQQPKYREKVPKTAGWILTALCFLLMAVALTLVIIQSRKEGAEYVAFLADTHLPVIACFVLALLTDTAHFLFKK